MPAIPSIALVPPKPSPKRAKPENPNLCKSCDTIVRDTDECGCSD
jgi:hypothetical protein